MGAGASLSSLSVLGEDAELADLSEAELEELYAHLKSEYEKKLREINVRHLETLLVSQLSVRQLETKPEEAADDKKVSIQ